MAFNFEKIAGISKELQSNENKESARQELADYMAFLVGGQKDYFDNGRTLQKNIEASISSLPKEERQAIISELKIITESNAWNTANEIISGALDLDKEIERITGEREEIEIYSHTVRRPEEIQHFKDFLNPEEGPTHYWIPRKYDIQRYIKTAIEAHALSGRSGAIKILDIGGGSGFLAKLIADEAKNQSLELEITVMDPDTETVDRAKETFSDTSNLSFEIGTSNQALAMFGPELTADEQMEFDQLEKKKMELVDKGKEDLSYIKALLISLEGEDYEQTDTADISKILSGAYGGRASSILEQSGFLLDNLPPFEELLDTITDFYNSRWRSYHKEILAIKDDQEKIYASEGTGQAKIDVVLNSWMPIGLDFTREMRMMNAPAIIYARERGGATGIDYVNESPPNIGKETSYGSGDNYEDFTEWEGVATSSISNGEHGYVNYFGNISNIFTHKSVDISDEDLEIPNPKKEEKYAWEDSLEQLIGRQRVENRKFY